jgi:hypothetical protein
LQKRQQKQAKAATFSAAVAGVGTFAVSIVVAGVDEKATSAAPFSAAVAGVGRFAASIVVAAVDEKATSAFPDKSNQK